MCSSRIEPSIIIEMFMQGIDGVFVGGCHPGDCHYIEGNYHTVHRMALTKKLLERAGLDPSRLRLEWVSASEALRFAEIMREMAKDMKELGPNPVSGEKPDIDILEKLLIARNAADDFRLRLLAGKAYIVSEKGNVYNKMIDAERLKALMDDVVDEEILRQKILLSLMKKSSSVKDIAKDIDTPPQDVLEQLIVLRDRGLIALDRIDGSSPIYTYLEHD